MAERRALDRKKFEFLTEADKPDLTSEELERYHELRAIQDRINAKIDAWIAAQ